MSRVNESADISKLSPAYLAIFKNLLVLLMTTQNYLGKINTVVSIGICQSNFTPFCNVKLSNDKLNPEHHIPTVYYSHFIKKTKSKAAQNEKQKVGQLPDNFKFLIGQASKTPTNFRLEARLMSAKRGNEVDIEIKVFGLEKYINKLRQKGINIESTVNSNIVVPIPAKRAKLAHFDFSNFWNSYKPDPKAILSYRQESSPPGLLSNLLVHQQQGLAWLWDFENPLQLFDQNPDRVVQFYRKLENDQYSHLLQETVTANPKFIRNCIVADDMGLGKTILIIALMLKEKSSCSNTEWYKRGPNLIVCPKTLIDNWQDQIEEHCEPGALDVFVLYGESAKQFPNFDYRDVVITTYETVTSKSNQFAQIYFNRIILDEAHKIRNIKSSYYLSLAAIDASCYIALTGTPINNNLEDLGALCQFIKIPYFKDPDNFKLNIGTKKVGIVNQKKTSLLSECFILRRTKGDTINNQPIVNLPEKIEETVKVSLAGKEKSWYFKILENYQYLLEMKNEEPSRGGQIILSTRLRQCVNHFSLTENDVLCLLIKVLQQPPPESDVVWIDNYINALFYFLNLQSGTSCFTCDQELAERCICYHCQGIFCCTRCAYAKVNGVRLCKINDCKKPVKIYSIPENYAAADYPFEDMNKKGVADVDSQASTVDLSTVEPSEKMKIILKILNSMDGKCVIFSQWKTMLDIYKVFLEENGFKAVMLDGSLTKEQRNSNIQKFKNNAKYTVLLMTLGLGTGLNLTCANNVIIADLWYNPFVIAQAVDRCYRIGQTKNVMVYKIVCEDSIEGDTIEPMLERKEDISNKVISSTKVKSAEKENIGKAIKREFERLKDSFQ